MVSLNYIATALGIITVGNAKAVVRYLKSSPQYHVQTHSKSSVRLLDGKCPHATPELTSYRSLCVLKSAESGCGDRWKSALKSIVLTSFPYLDGSKSTMANLATYTRIDIITAITPIFSNDPHTDPSMSIEEYFTQVYMLMKGTVTPDTFYNLDFTQGTKHPKFLFQFAYYVGFRCHRP